MDGAPANGGIHSRRNSVARIRASGPAGGIQARDLRPVPDHAESDSRSGGAYDLSRADPATGGAADADDAGGGWGADGSAGHDHFGDLSRFAGGDDWRQWPWRRLFGRRGLEAGGKERDVPVRKWEEI